MRLLMGKAKSGKTYTVNSEISEAVAQGLGHNVILLVPEQYTLEAEKQLIMRLKTPGFIGLEVLSFKRLCHRLFEETGNPNTTGISDIGKMMTLRRVFIEEKPHLKTYANVIDKPGFINKFYETLQIFKQTMVTPEAIVQIAENAIAQPLLHGKLHDIARVYKRYEAVKESVFSDGEDRYNIAIERLEVSKWIVDKQIWIDGFDSFTGQEYAIVQSLERHAAALNIALCHDPRVEGTLFSHTERAFEKLKRISEENARPFEHVVLDWVEGDSDFQFLAENILNYPYQSSLKTDPALTIDAAMSRHNEVVTCATQMIEWVRDKGYRWSDMAVVTNALGQYEASLFSVFKMYSIPYFLDAKSSVMSHPLVHLIVSSCRGIMSYQSHHAIVQTLKSGFFSLENSDIAALEMYMLQYGLNERHITKPFTKEPHFKVPLESIEKTRIKYNNAVEPLRVAQHSKDNTAKDFVLALIHLLEHLGVQHTLQQQVDAFMREGNFDEGQRFAQIWNLIMSVFEEIVLLMGDMPMDMSTFLPLLETGLEALEVGHLPLDDNRVIVGSLDRSKSHPIKVLFILGLNEGVLPEMASDGQLIGDAEKDYLTALGFGILPDQTMFLNKETFNIYMALTRPTAHLFLSFARNDAEGSALRPSHLVAKALKVFPKAVVHSASLGDEHQFNLSQLASPEAVLPQLASVLRRSKEGVPIDKEWFSVLQWYEAHSPVRAKRIVAGLNHDNQVKALSAHSVEQAYDSPMKTSVSRLEDYTQCPFKYFVSTGLAPKSVKPFRLDYPDVGIMFHKALENFGKTLYTQGLEWQNLSETDCEHLMDQIVDEMVNIDLFQSKNAYRYLIKKLKRVSRRAAATLTRHLRQGKFVPAAFELTFSEGTYGVPPIVIELESGKKLLLRGVIDRVDLLQLEGETFVKIIDYKSGQQKMSFSEVYHGLQMQLMVYLQACLQSPGFFKVDSLQPAGAFYFKIDDPLLQTTEQITDKLSEELSHKLRLDGVVVDVESVIKQIDHEALEKGISDVIQVKLKTDGSYTKDSKVIPAEDLHLMMQWVRKTVRRIGNDLYQGKISIEPCQMGTFKSCQYCDYKALCQFDVKFRNNTYHKLTPLSDDEVFDNLKKQEVIAHGELDI